ncbi:acyl-CoA synthetase [Rhodococcus gannanensis]|uniref:Acyl-CoA synthetase n=1 Tax=Rhodococcus gannanensis TaxID=1960308 RepID=A0ABW4P4V6_9NOCA
MSDHPTPPNAAFTIPEVADAVAAVVPDRELVAVGDRHLSYSEVAERSRRLGAYLRSRGLGCHTERGELPPQEVGQDMLGIYAYNGNEYVEAMLGAFRARVAPFNVNYRYIENELLYLLEDAGATALVYNAAFAPALVTILPRLPKLTVLIQIADESGNALLDGAVDYEEAVATGGPESGLSSPEDHRALSPDDLYVLYTGGTTGMPKGVLWRQHDIYMSACGGKDFYTGTPVGSYEAIAERARSNPGLKVFVVPPLIHGAAQWAALTALATGQSLVFPPPTGHLDPESIVRTIEHERPAVVMVVGDATARPLLSVLERGDADTSSIAIVANGGAQLTPTIKQRLLDLLPNAIVMDGAGSSETGAQMMHVSTAGSVTSGVFNPSSYTCVLSENLDAVCEPGHDGIGWLAQRGFVPLGYKGDEKKTAATFPVIDGVRYALPGDRARHLEDGSLQLLGRDSVTINSGGEKIFVEEVESAIASHPAVVDVIVVGRPSERWGEEVVAIVVLADGTEHRVDEATIIAHAADSVARYKLPKSVLFRPHIVRSPVGKADYRWAREQAAAATQPAASPA